MFLCGIVLFYYPVGQNINPHDIWDVLLVTIAFWEGIFKLVEEVEGPQDFKPMICLY